MVAAVYTRKSNEQSGIADEQKSVVRQIDHARQYGARKGWTVSDEHVYVDDGISGAEFSNRPGFVRLMNALKPRPAFQVLIMSEESRLGREAIETAYALNRTARGTRGAAKQGKYADRPMSEWIRFELEDLVTDALWQAAHAQLTARRENYHALTRQDARRTIEARGGVEATCCRGLRPVRAVAAPFR
jgi:hypothetical protein